MKSLNDIVAAVPQVMPQVADLVWGNDAERLCAVDALAATRDRRLLPLLCERIGDPCQEVVAQILAGIDRIDPITAIQVAREMATDGRRDHLDVVQNYFRRNAPWELSHGAPSPQETIADLRTTNDEARLRRALIAPHPGVRRAAARQLVTIADRMSLADLDVHLEGKIRIPLEGILEVLVYVQTDVATQRAKAAAVAWNDDGYALLAAMARVGGRGTSILLLLLDPPKGVGIDDVLLQYRPRELLQCCRDRLLLGDEDSASRAAWLLHDFVREGAATSRALQRAALEVLLAGLVGRPEPGLKAQVLQVLAKSADRASLSVDAVKMLRHSDSSVRCAALKFLASQGRERAVEVAGRVLANECQDVLVRIEALEILARLEPDRRLERARAAMEEGNTSVLDAALDSLDDVDVPESLCDEGCQHLRHSIGVTGRVLVDWLLNRFPQRSTQILLSALGSETPAVRDYAAGVLFGCGEGGP